MGMDWRGVCVCVYVCVCMRVRGREISNYSLCFFKKIGCAHESIS